jgi:glucan 1,3-beta-glucosidase
MLEHCPLISCLDPSNTWSYKTGLSLGTIPQDVSNASQLVFPRLDNGCIDSSFDWQAPERVNGGLALGIPSFAYGLTGLVALLALL